MSEHLTRAAALSARLRGLGAQRTLLEQQRETLKAEADMLWTRIQMAPRVKTFLDTVQAKAHERTVGVYESILTGIVTDVLGPLGQVKLQTYQRAGVPALDVKLLKPEGQLEDVLEGNGGALTNAVCAGLRFAAIARAGLRKFIVLDEPDCWLKEERSAAFYKALSEVCDQAGFQAVVVSHHDIRALELPASVSFIELEAGPDGYPRALSRRSGPVGPNALTHLWVKNVQSHRDTYVEFGPGLTLLSGANNLGKSALIHALRVVAQGGASDDQIMHGMDSLFVELGFNNDGKAERIALTRRRKGSPRVVLQHLSASEEELHAERGSPSTAPDWVRQVLGIHEIEELDPQLLSQKTPVFLLDRPASVRAQILYAGKEASILAKMFELHARQIRDDRRDLERVQARLLLLDAALEALAGIPELTAAARELETNAQATDARQSKTVALGRILPQMEAAFVRAGQAVPSLPALLIPRDIGALGQRIARMRGASHRAGVSVPAVPDAPLMQPAQGVLALGVRVQRAQTTLNAVAKLPEVPPLVEMRALDALQARARRLSALAQVTLRTASLGRLPELPEVAPVAQLLSSATRLSASKTAQARLAADILQAQTDMQAAEAEVTEAIRSTGGVCPACRQALNSGTHVHFLSDSRL